jgi:long-chain acyl-CoA synthetase
MQAVWLTLAVSAARNPAREAIVHGDERWSYLKLLKRSLGLAERLASAGVEPGDRVALLYENSVGYLTAYYAVQRLGAVLVGLNPVNDAHTLNRIFADCEPKVLIGQAKYLRRFSAGLAPETRPPVWFTEGELECSEIPVREPQVQCLVLQDWEADRLELPLPEGDAPAMILYTSGTTGSPKGVTLSQRNLIANCGSIVEYLELDESERVLVLLPFYYSYGHSLLITHIAVGACLVLDNRFAFPSTVLETLLDERVTGLPGVPSTFNILMSRTNLGERSFPDLRYFTTAGGALAPAALARLREMLPGVQPVPMYGQTEGTARLSYLPAADLERKPGSIGRGIPGVELSVLGEDGEPVPVGETGEIVAAGANIMQGYWKDSEETAGVIDSRGRLRTGDLARVDEEGFIWIVGRSKEMIKSGAFRINPKEIEELMAELPGLALATVVGVPDPILGEKMVACGIRNGIEEMSEKDVLRYLKRRLPHWKQPQEMHFFDEFPMTSSGKIQKHRLAEWLCGDVDERAVPLVEP